MRRAVPLVIVLAGLLLAPAMARQEENAQEKGKEDLKATILHLLDFVRTSDVVFIRNGKEHTPEKAAEHIEKKCDHYRKKIKTPEDFIEYSATKSMMSGKPYQVRLKDGKVIATSEWLAAELHRYRMASEGAATDTLGTGVKCGKDSL